MHSHPFVELVYHVQGEGVTKVPSGRTYPFRKDSLVVYGAGVSHDQTMDFPGEDACIQVELPVDSSFPKFDCLHVMQLNDSYLQNEILRLTAIGSGEGLSEQSRLSLDFRVSALLNDILEMTKFDHRNVDNTSETKVEIAHRYIVENFRTLASVEEVAEHVGLSYDYLRHRFKETYGTSLIQHLLDTKLDYARKLLMYSPLPLKQIAEESGFSNSRYFNTAFKKAMGITPGQFRKQ